MRQTSCLFHRFEDLNPFISSYLAKHEKAPKVLGGAQGADRVRISPSFTIAFDPLQA